MQINDPAIPPGSVVVVIGANGFIGAETCEKLLQAGYKVRGTVRNVAEHRGWMHALFDEQWPGQFELVGVTDFAETGAFDAAFKGAAGVIYVSTPILFDPDPAQVVEPTVRATINTLEAAARAGVQRYVLSSSSKAVEATVYDGVQRRLTTGSYNWDAILRTCTGPREDSFAWMLHVYSAGRTLAELAFWSWLAGHPDAPFVANCVVPDGNFGRGLHGATSTNALLQAVLAGEWDRVPMSLGFVIDVEDTARLLVAAAAKTSLSNERIFAYASRATWNDLRQRVRAVRPELVQGQDEMLPGTYRSTAQEAIQRAEGILRDVGRPGFISEDAMLESFLDACY